MNELVIVQLLLLLLMMVDPMTAQLSSVLLIIVEPITVVFCSANLKNSVVFGLCLKLTLTWLVRLIVLMMLLLTSTVMLMMMLCPGLRLPRMNVLFPSVGGGCDVLKVTLTS